MAWIEDLKIEAIDLAEEFIKDMADLLDEDLLISEIPKSIIELNKKFIKDLEKLDDSTDADTVLIRCDNMVLRSKLEDFLRTEIYPFYRQYDDNVTFF